LFIYSQDTTKPIFLSNVASKHKEAQTFLRKGFFEGLKSFRDFEARTEKLANTKEVGDALEILVEAHLHLDQVLKAKNVWVVGDIPLNVRKSLNLPADSKGIDGVYEDASGNIIPYQVKYRTDKETLPYGEVSSFLGITEESLKDRVIFTNARNLAADITKRKGLRSFKAAQFHSLTEEDFNRIHAWLSDKKPAFKRWSPQTHQKEAIEKITVALKVADRTTAVMACGTGKTLVALWAAEAQEPKTVLVLVPSLALLSQTLPDWCKQTSWGERFRYLCVCSDASVDRSAKEDEYALRQSDIEFSVTTDAKVVKDFLSDNRSGVNVIFSTYQSAEVVAEGLKGQTVDLGIFDEAHKTTGDKEGLFAFGLSDKNIRIKKRLFLTATPRHYKLNKRDKDGDFQVVSMNDEAVYGKVSYRLPFSTAVAAGIIVPYKVIISVSLNKEVDAELLRRGSTRVRRDEIQSKWVANQIALKRAIEKTGASKIITFHSRVNLAEDFAGDDSRGFKEHVKGFDVFHVNGSQNAADRKALLEGFKTAPKGLITNARCLTEGVDVPAVDMVAFVDPRKSKIDIAQAAGRAMRQSKATNKKLGYIVVPLFIEQKKGETESEALTRSGFDEVALVLGAMLESDDDLVDTVKEMQEARGSGDKFNPKLLREKIEVIGPAVDLGELTRSIDVEILDRLGQSWHRWYGLLHKFHKQRGHSRVAADDVLDGLRIGIWVNNQRQNKDKLSQEQIRLLELLDFSWDPLTEQWEENYQALRTFISSSGNRYVVQGTVFKGYNLGSWVNAQRIKKRKGLLTLEQIKKLDSIRFSWEPISDQWNEAFNALKIFKKKTGHCRITKKQDSDYPNLGIWVQVQRTNKSRLTIEQINKLGSIGFSWDPLTEKWEEAFEALNDFRKKEGHCRVPRDKLFGGIELGNWVSLQRRRFNSGLMPKPQAELLNSIGFSWDPLSDYWEEAFSELVKFHKSNGHCNVPQLKTQNNTHLGSWVSKQRKNKARLSTEQVRRLESINFCWDLLSQQWEESFDELVKFHKLEGHCRVAAKFVVNKIGLGMWVSRQRKKRPQLSEDQLKRLDSLGFCWDPLSEQWDDAFSELVRFRKREGHCRVAARLSIGSLRLGVWVSQQRQNKEQLTRDKIKKLDSIGFCWDPLAGQWDEAFNELTKFHMREGHCRVTKSYISNGIKLGHWVIRQRRTKGQLTPDRIKRLNSLGFIWKA
jgi:superfamily II DNA or RNA helicase